MGTDLHLICILYSFFYVVNSFGVEIRDELYVLGTENLDNGGKGDKEG